MIKLLAIVAWAAIGIPYGVSVYKQRLVEGSTKGQAITRGILRGAIWPLEQLGKAIKAAWTSLLG